MIKAISASVLLLTSLLLFTGAYCQQSKDFEQPDAAYLMAVELFESGKYGASQKIFSELLHGGSRINQDIQAQASFYDALCAAELSHPDATARITSYLDEHPGHSGSKTAWFYLGKMYFNKSKYRDAIEAFQKVKREELASAQQDEYDYKTGYAYLKINKPDKAKKYFQRQLKRGSDYAAASTYYYAHINYLEGNYTQALLTFESLKNDPGYKKIVPYYILHIHYYLGNYDEIISQGTELVSATPGKQQAEAARIVGDAFYRAGDYQEAVRYLEIYEKRGRTSLSREDNFQLGYACLQTGSYRKAIDKFQKVVKGDDALTQDGYYYLGICYVYTEQKKYAANAFLSAYKLDSDRNISEESLFNYIKLSIETSFNPYNEAITLLDEYIRDHKQSARLDEAYGYLVELYLNSKNYSQALASIENIARRNDALDEAYQQIAYYRGIEVFNDGGYQESSGLFQQSIEHGHNVQLLAEARYWAGEAYYRLGDYSSSVKYYKAFLKSKGATACEMYPMAD